MSGYARRIRIPPCPECPGVLMMQADMSRTSILKVTGREVMDSRGNPTVEVDVALKAVRVDARPCPPVPAPASTRHWNCGTGTRHATSGRE